MKPRLFTGIQPSGLLHIGNYLGAVKNCVELQENYDSFLCIVDLHAITVRQVPETLRKNILDTARHYLASGIDPAKATLFTQSEVSEHSELCWILNTIAKMGEMERMTQYKDKAHDHAENINIGLFDYPVLMAADILLYDTVLVPVGEDQKQHLELAQELAERFNSTFGKNIFLTPKPLIKSRKEGSRIMGLDDPSKKMSKSAPSEYNYIALSDSPADAVKKIMKATTDSGSDIKVDPARPGITNLLTIFSLLTGIETADLEKRYAGQGYSKFKEDLAKAVEEFLTEHQKKLAEYDNNYISQILGEGALKAREIAQKKMFEVKQAVGLA